MKIHPSRPTDLAVLNAIHNAHYPDQLFPLGNPIWVIEDGGQVVGYTAVSPIPGLDNIFNLTGAIAPNWQRQGLGSRLLAHVLREAPALGMRQLSHTITNLDSSAAHFLRHHNFVIEHEEWLMQLSPLPLRTPTPPQSCHLQTRLSPTQLFLSLYDKSFGNTPWYQPYSQEEVENTLDNPEDVLFLFKDSQPIGFAWLQGEMIEPIGIVKGEWGQGYGRYLLLAAFHQLNQRRAAQARIGVWCDNQAAIRLYQSLGFQHQQTLTYMALNINRNE